MQSTDPFTQQPSNAAPRRGRGRPRVANPLTPAERARRYRQRRKTAEVTALGKAPARAAESKRDDRRIAELEHELTQLREQSARLQQWVYDAAGALEQILLVRARRKGISAELMAGIERLLERPVFTEPAAATRTG